MKTTKTMTTKPLNRLRRRATGAVALLAAIAVVWETTPAWEGLE